MCNISGALMEANRQKFYHFLKYERIHLLLIDEAIKGLEDVAAGRVSDARQTLQKLKIIRSK